MVGGRSAEVQREVLCRFEFPERPGALTKFLDALGDRWNISLFHYRNHGADPGRVLAGLEVPNADDLAFQAFLDQLGYRYERESDNAVYSLFLR
jgi:threonine dehydratase